MKKEELQKRIDEIDWWHSIDLPTDDFDMLVTPGAVDHCSEELATDRFGMPLSLKNKTVLDVGTWDGYFAFLAEKRGGIVTAIDPLQGCSHMDQGTAGFELAKEVLESNVTFYQQSLFVHSLNFGFGNLTYDIVLYYGVLYHVEDPIGELYNLFKITGEFALIETAISPEIELNGERLPNWVFKPGHENDPTNFFYPNLTGLETALKHVGFKSMDFISATPGGERATVRANK